MKLNASQHPSVAQKSRKQWTISPPPSVDPSRFELAKRISHAQSQNFEPNGRSPTSSVKIGNCYCKTLIDTGSSITIVPRRLLHRIGGTRLPYISAADGMSGPIKIVAHILVDIEVYGYLVRQHECAVIEESPALTGRETDALIGTDLFIKLPPLLFNFQAGKVQLVPYDFQISQQTASVQVRGKRIEIKSRTNKSPIVILEDSEIDQEDTINTTSVDPPTVDRSSKDRRELATHKSHPHPLF